MTLYLKDITENPWRNIEFEKSIHTFTMYNKPVSHWPIVREIDGQNPLPGIKFELMNVVTGRTKVITGHIRLEIAGWGPEDSVEPHIPIDLAKVKVVVQWNAGTGWGKNVKGAVYAPVEDVRYRIDNKHLSHVHWVQRTLQVGDFVKCKGTRSGDWNKVDTISSSLENIFGQKYTKPEAGSERYASSTNHISKVLKIVRNGKELKNENS